MCHVAAYGLGVERRVFRTVDVETTRRGVGCAWKGGDATDDGTEGGAEPRPHGVEERRGGKAGVSLVLHIRECQIPRCGTGICAEWGGKKE